MSKKKLLCVYDGGITKQMMELLRDLEKYGVEIDMIEDDQCIELETITTRMHLIEYHGVNAAPTLPALKKAIEDVNILCVHVASVNKEILEAAKKLELVAVMRGGYENADVPELEKRKIPLINSPWRSANAVADFTVGMMIAENKNIARSHKLLFDGVWEKNYVNQKYIHDMRKSTVGIIGFGYIGSRVAKRLSGFEAKVIAHDPFDLEGKAIKAAGVPNVSLDELVATSDYVTIHMRLSDKTIKFMDAEKFAKMKPTAYFINMSRAGLADTDALVEVLRNKKIGGAAVDVFDEEPLPKDHPYLSLNNVTLTSHLAGTSADTMQTSVEIALEDLERYLKNEPMVNVRNKI
jgi:D-3-phosphoglycerate dehydrogenase